MTRLVYFTADWCAPCRRFGPLLKAEAEARGLRVQRLDVDDSASTAQAYGVQSVPTVIALRDGEIVDRFAALSAPQLRERLDALTA